MEPDHTEISVRRQCELLGVNRSGLYYQPLGESAENLKLMRLIDEEYTRRPFYGSRKMLRWLKEQGCQVGRHRVRRLMGLLGLEAVYPKPKLSQPGEGHKLYPYLLNGVAITRVNQVWSTALGPKTKTVGQPVADLRLSKDWETWARGGESARPLTVTGSMPQNPK